MKETVEKIVNNVLSDKGIELVDINYHTGGKRTVIRVFIDKPSGGITVEECAVVNRALNVNFLVEDSIPDNTIIEVSSPGMDRPLRMPRDFERNLHRVVDVYYTEVGGRSFSATGTLTAVHPDGITLKTAKGDKSIPHASIVNAKRHIDCNDNIF
ncbi:MAG: ribosome maturation factor RimP [Fibrobacterota bacterium]